MFAIIGFLNTLVHGSILITAVEYFNAAVVLAHFIAFFFANMFSYIMNSKLTFRIDLSFLHYCRFLMASMLALGLTLSLSWVTDQLGLHYLFGFLLIIVLVPALTFITLKSWAFAKNV